MQLEMINKLFLELSQVATAKTARECLLEDVLVSVRTIAQRHGENTAWATLDAKLESLGVGSVTAKVFKLHFD